ncbi:MAG: adenylate/guanylate cyclase domain-containing protein [Spirochaetales bacterium]|nr:adenylate/guanylate cyclase domain-containing protein [Spirochaetales bacterium]
MIIKQRKNKYAIFFFLAFLILGLTYLIQLAGEWLDIISSAPLLLGPALFYLVLCSLPVYSYFRQENLIREQNLAFSRFVPQEFLGFLKKDDITQIRLGDQIERDITILFADIRSFTTISESMTPEENFDFLNRFLRAIGPIVRENGGFIDKYIGDAIMALFATRADDALHAAVQMQARVDELNGSSEGGRFPNITIGIGIHTGKTMLGIVGEAERYQGTVISDAVNLASRLEGLTKKAGHPIIVSSATVALLEETFPLRVLGNAREKGKTGPIKVYTFI